MSVRTESTSARDVAYQLHPFTHLRRHQEQGPLVITRGQGIYVYDEARTEYIEAMAGLWCTALGFGEERLVEARGETDAPAAVLSPLRPQGA